MTTFKELGLSAEILEAITAMGFEKPSDIQAEAIPLLLKGDSDFIGLAQTGTGKTAAFGLPLLELIEPLVSRTQGLVLAPTRELGQQIAEQLYLFSKQMPELKVMAVYGGAPINNQIKGLRQKTPHVIIATPGRLIDLVKRKAIRLDDIQNIVLDEADEMLNMGFKEDLDTILEYVPDEAKTWLFSATMPNEIKNIVKKYMTDPVEVKVNAKQEVNANISHEYVFVKHSNKAEALTRFLDATPEMRGVVFCRTKRDTQALAEYLLRKDYKADALHGDLTQAQRDRVMRRFKKHDLKVLIATDVAARGIDVNDLTHVFHFALPDDLAYYTHRSGRTARAGKKGTSISFVPRSESYKVRRIERMLGIEFGLVKIPSSEEIARSYLESWIEGIVSQGGAKQLDPELLEEVTLLLGGISKEELIAKLLVKELNKLPNQGEDLNEERSASSRRGSSSGSHRDRSSGGGSRGKRPYKNKGHKSGGYSGGRKYSGKGKDGGRFKSKRS